MSFLKEHGTAAILLAAIFMSLGFMMGKCNSGKCGLQKQSKCHKGHGEKCGHKGHKSHSDCSVWISDDHIEGHSENMVIVKALMDDGFVGDTTLVIPGGEIVLSIGDDGEVNVEVDIEDHHSDGDDVHEVHKEVRIIKTSE